MKIKRVLFFIVMFLIIGITGVKAISKNIEITNVEVKEKSGTITVVDPVLVSNEVTSNITFNQIDDFVTFELTLKNNESEKYKITSITDNNINENIQVEYSFSKDYISTGETSKVTLKLKYKNKLLNVDEISLNDLTITFNLESEEGKEEEIIINPTTGDNIFHYLVLLIIALVGIGLIVAKKKIKGIKIGSLFVVLAVVLLPLAVFANEKYEISLKFTNVDIKGEFETYSITIDPGNGDAPTVKDITYGQKIGDLPADPSKDGYTFDKWVDEEGNEVTKDTIINGPIEVIATYNLATYNISYDLDDGSLPSGKSNPTEYTIESQSITLNNPEKRGYTFAGWTGTGIDGQTTEVTIDHGSFGDRSYKAHYLAKDDTKYTVIHKFEKLGGGYEEETVEEHGTTGSTVPAPRKTRTGFITPAVQNVTIEADESASVTYIYDRETYAFSITDRKYVDSTSTADGTYKYETPITIKAVEREGYDFSWSDGETALERTFNITEPISLTPVYTAKTDTAYKVVHQKQKITLDGYEIADTQNLTGETDTSVTPEVNTYEGFTSPQTQTTTIKGDGSTVVTYNYDRIMYDFSTNNNEDVISSIEDGRYPYGTEITLTAKDKSGYTFSKWSNDETSNPYTFNIDENITIKPIYSANTDTAYKVEHKTQNIDGSYKLEEEENLTGTTDSSITPAVKTYTGFTSPETQTVTIKGDGTTVVTYNYTRNKYTLTIEDSEYVEEDKSGEYYYQESVRVKAIDREGYDFAGWSNGETAKEVTITIGAKNITVKPLYTAGTETRYKVEHEYARLNGDYEIDEVILTGTTDTTVPAPLKPRTGFVTPEQKNVTITGDGKAKVTYTYERENYTFSISDRTYLDSTSTANGSYPYETEITVKAQEREGYTFAWSDEVTDYTRTFELTGNTELSLIYIPNIYTIKYNANGGVGEMEDQDLSYDEKDTLNPNTFTKTGYTFIGWNDKPDGSGTPYEDEEEVEGLIPSGNIILYAQWIGNELVFEPVTKNVTYSTENQTFNVTAATNGTGSYTYEKISGDFGIAVSTTGVVTVSANLGVGTHEVYIKATDSNSGSNKTAKYTVTIEQKKAVITLGETPSVTYGTDSTLTYTYDGDGTVNCSSSSTTYVTCSVNTSTKTITLTPVKPTTSNVTITVSAGAGTNYSAADNKTATVTVGKGVCNAPTNVTIGTDKKVSFTNASNASSYQISMSESSGFTAHTNGAVYNDITATSGVRTVYVRSVCDTTYYEQYSSNASKETIVYSVTFDTDGGSTVSNQNIVTGSKATRPTTDPTKTGYTFDDWYTDDTYTTKFDFDTPITSDTTIYAHFEELKVCANNENITRLSENTCSNNENITIGDGIVCKRAVKLHEETCSQTSTSEYCSGAGYTTSGSKGTSTITYGSCGTSGTLSSGDAFTCDVNGDEKFDELTERFYYVSDYYDTSAKEFDDSTAVLIYYNNVTSGVSCNYNRYAYDSSNENWHGPRTLVSQLPTTSQWSNISLKSDTRAILAEYQSTHDSPTTSGGTLPTDFSYEGYAARLLTAKELMAGCNLTEVGRQTTGELDSCNYIMENTKYAKSSIGSYGPWLETPFASNSNNVWYDYGGNRSVNLTNAGYTSSLGARPVIEVPKSKIEYGASSAYAVTLNANGGSVNPASITVNIGDAIGTLPEPTPPTNKTFDGWYTDLTGGIEVTSSYVPNTDIEIYARYNNSTHTVSFDTDGGSTVASQTVSYGSTVTRPATDPTKTGYTFDDWYTDDTYTTKFNFDTAITEDTTIYAHFEELKVCANNENITRLSENTCSNNENITVGDGIVCKRAVKLHEETCSQTVESYYCSGAGYTESGSKGTSTITYGSCGTSGTLSSGDAFTCDVNGDEKFDELTERFYYVSDYYDTSAKEFDDSTAVLIYYNNVTSGVSCNKYTYAYSIQADIQTVDPSRTSYDNWHGPLTVMKQLPTTSQWSNVSLKSEKRAILGEYQSTHDSPTTSGGTLPTDFSYEGYAARLLTAKELMAGCNLTEVGRYTDGELDSCNYIMENTEYAKSTIGSLGGWLETPHASNSGDVWYVFVFPRRVNGTGAFYTSYYGARPVIEVPKSKIEYGASSEYTVTLNANGGSVNPTSITVNIGDAIGTLPTPTAPTGKSFTGWYTDLTGGIEVTSSYVPNTDIEIYARYNSTYTVSFDTDGGSTVPSQTVSYGSTATRPTTDPTSAGYTFDDWYTDDTYITKFDFDTPITSDTTIYAHFEELKVCADNENITTLSENTCSNNENITVGDGIVCKRAVKLHEETCSQTDGTRYCSGAGYTESGSKGTSTITYGSCGTSGTLLSGDAFTCDVNGDGDFDELTERFYYLSDYYDTSAKEFDDSTAVLIYYNNVTSGVSCNRNTFAYDSSNENWHGPRTLVSQLPTTSQWSNVELKNTTRQILTQTGATSTSGGTLPEFDYSGYAARFITAQELNSACGITIGNPRTGELDSCNYIMENTKYAKSSIGSYGHWLETPHASVSDVVWYVSGFYRNVNGINASDTSGSGARPAIEVLKSKISY